MAEIQLHARVSKERPVCVSCRGELGSTDAALACTECAVPLHWECWRELKRCPTPGCPGEVKHSARLAATLETWGPAEPLEWSHEPAALELEPLPARPAHGPAAPPPGKGDEGSAERAASEAAQVSPRAEDVQRAEPSRGVTHDAGYLTTQGMIYGAVAGAVCGMVWALFSMKHPGVAVGFGGGFAGATAGGLAGFGLGYLQSLVGLCDPQPEGLGLLSLFLTGGVGFVAYGAGGWALALLLGLPTWLLCGRMFGFDPGKSRS
ncbi:MAG: hypothetical protein KDD82_04835 [Planctomycetes bacterium]|nr:hypothetical protein [Planctomycetota bacterium]